MYMSSFSWNSRFLLTRLLRGATDAAQLVPFYYEISTHTPLARRDLGLYCVGTFDLISTHTPLARRDQNTMADAASLNDFYSHASCEARQKIIEPPAGEDYISTHTPLARRDETVNSDHYK